MTTRALLILTTLLLILPGAATAAEPRTAIVLCYHIVESPHDARMEVSRETFLQQMRYLAMTGYNVIPLRHLHEYVSGKRASIPKNAVVVTVDDGWRSTYTEIYPEMKKRNLPFTVFIYPKIIGNTANALSWKQIKEMSDNGVDIQSHTLSHGYLTSRRHASKGDKAYSEWLWRELAESRRILEKETGRKVEFLAYPYGDYDQRVATVSARAGYSAALTCDFGPVRPGSDPLKMKRFVVDKRMDFAQFRRYLGASHLALEAKPLLADGVVEPEQPVVLEARIPNYRSIDPKSVRMAMITPGSTTPFSYDATTGSIRMVLREASANLQGKPLRALVWATDMKTGKRVEASWTVRVPAPSLPVASVVVPSLTPIPRAAGVASVQPAAGGGSTADILRAVAGAPAQVAATKNTP